jgi:adenine-specific DNA-methyltransferase
MSRGGWGELSIMRFIINDPSFKTRRRTLRNKQTDAEYKLWQRLRNKQVHGLKFYRQYSVGAPILDFFCPQRRLAIEWDGSQHLAAKEQDDDRTVYLQRLGINVIRFWDHEVLQETDVVMEVIWNKLLKEEVLRVTPPNPLLS